MRIIKKQLNEIAEVIKNYHEAEETGNAYNLAEGMADILENYNPLFDRQKFLKACEVEKEHIYLSNICKICGFEMIGVHYHERKTKK